MPPWRLTANLHTSSGAPISRNRRRAEEKRENQKHEEKNNVQGGSRSHQLAYNRVKASASKRQQERSLSNAEESVKRERVRLARESGVDRFECGGEGSVVGEDRKNEEEKVIAVVAQNTKFMRSEEACEGWEEKKEGDRVGSERVRGKGRGKFNSCSQFCSGETLIGEGLTKGRRVRRRRNWSYCWNQTK